MKTVLHAAAVAATARRDFDTNRILNLNIEICRRAQKRILAFECAEFII